jgi:hypothetical protein
VIQISTLDKNLISKIISSVERNQLDFFEYRFFTDIQLKQHLKETLQMITKNDDSCLVSMEKDVPTGFVTISKNDFDSSFFGFDCYQINMNVFCDTKKVNKTSEALIKEAEKLCQQNANHFYIYLSINNNFPNTQPVFNTLTDNNYHFISTLLTFSLQNKNLFKTSGSSDKILIRTAKNSDVETISKLAEKSFKYSRFHMDPFLDNQHANMLLKTSARNSILNNYVDIMFVAEINNNLVGYYSGKKKYYPEFNKTFGTAVISAVDSEYRGKGVFNALDTHLLNWFSDNCEFAEMGTYLVNYPVHKTWINKGLGLIRGTYQFSKYV